MNSGSSAFISSGGQSADTSAVASCHQISRCLCHATSPPVRLSTITLSIVFTSGLVSASSTFFLRGTARPPRTPSSAVITTLAFESIIRPDSASGEKPPNTTVWTAPIRVQASIATAASGTIGMYRHTTSPFCTPCSLSALENSHTSLCSSLKVSVLSSAGSSPSQMIATSSPRSARWRSIQFADTFNVPSSNQRILIWPLSNDVFLTLV